MRTCAPCLAARGADSSDASHVLAILLQPCRNAYDKVDKSYSTGWLGRLPVLLYCWRSDKEWEQQLQSQLQQPIQISQPMVSVRCIEAIVNANNDAATHPDCPAGSGADTIILPSNANIALSAVFANTYSQFGSPVGLPPITSRITIEGNGATIARQGNAPAFGLIFVKGNSSPQGVPRRLGT